MEYIISDYTILGIWALFALVLFWWVRHVPVKTFKKTYEIWVGNTQYRNEVVFKKAMFRRWVVYNKKLTSQELLGEVSLFLRKGRLPGKASHLDRVYESSSRI